MESSPVRLWRELIELCCEYPGPEEIQTGIIHDLTALPAHVTLLTHVFIIARYADTEFEMGFLNDPPRPVIKRSIQDGVRAVLRIWATVYFRLRVHNIDRIPENGGMILCVNHASHLDPMIIGSIYPRRTNYLAKESLSRAPGLGWLIDQLDAIPIDRESGGISGMKETLRRLKRNESVLIFPEGTRTPDGTLQPIQPGVCALAKRVRSPMIPIGIAGTFEAWPRKRSFPIPLNIQAVIGTPITSDEIKGLSDVEITSLLQQRMSECLADAYERRSKALF